MFEYNYKELQAEWLKWSIERDIKALNELNRELGKPCLHQLTEQQVSCITQQFLLWQKAMEDRDEPSDWDEFLVWVGEKTMKEWA